MRRRPLLLLPALALLAGCTTAAPAPAPTTPFATAAPAPSVAPVAEPAPLPSEIARAVIDASTTTSTTGAVPAGTRAVYVHVRCSGPAGSTMRFRLEAPDGTAFGPSGDLGCTGEETTTGSAGAGGLPSRAQVVAEGSPGVTGYAVLSTSAAR